MTTNKRRNIGEDISKKDLEDDWFDDDGMESDERIDNIMPIIQSLEFLMQEAKKNSNMNVYKLIRCTFNMCLISYDMIQNKTKKDH